MPSDQIEYPDEAGYPDGMGYLDEGTKAPVARAALLADELDEPSADDDDDISVVSEATRFRAMLDGEEVAVMQVGRGADRVTITSTVVHPAFRNRGIATAFIAHVLDDLRDEGSTIVVECPEVAHFIDRHPEYADLIA